MSQKPSTEAGGGSGRNGGCESSGYEPGTEEAIASRVSVSPLRLSSDFNISQGKRIPYHLPLRQANLRAKITSRPLCTTGWPQLPLKNLYILGFRKSTFSKKSKMLEL